MRSLLILIFIISIQACAESPFSQYLALAGGTGGVGARYSIIVGDHFTGKTGLYLNYRYSKDKSDDTTINISNVYATPYFGVAFIPFRKKYHGLAIEIAGSIPLNYSTTTYHNNDSTLYNFNEIWIEAFVSPGVEYFWFGKNKDPKFSVEFGIIKIHPDNIDWIEVEALCNISIYLKKIGEKEKTNLPSAQQNK